MVQYGGYVCCSLFAGYNLRSDTVDRHTLQAMYGRVFASATYLACATVFVPMGYIDVLLTWAMRKFNSFRVSQFFELLYYISL